MTMTCEEKNIEGEKKRGIERMIPERDIKNVRKKKRVYKKKIKRKWEREKHKENNRET